jgi:hypothetical protein
MESYLSHGKVWEGLTTELMTEPGKKKRINNMQIWSNLYLMEAADNQENNVCNQKFGKMVLTRVLSFGKGASRTTSSLFSGHLYSSERRRFLCCC